MKQANKNLGKAEIKALVSQNFVNALEELEKNGTVKNASNFSKLVDTNNSNFSKIKNGEGRYITTDVLYNAVNKFGLNANFFFVKDGPKKEKLIRENQTVNIATITGNNNKGNKQNVKISGGINFAEQIIQHIPDEKEREEMKKYMSGMTSEIADLKKTIDAYKKQLQDKDNEIEKDKKLIETQEKLIRMYEEGKAKKK